MEGALPGCYFTLSEQVTGIFDDLLAHLLAFVVLRGGYNSVQFCCSTIIQPSALLKRIFRGKRLSRSLKALGP